MDEKQTLQFLGWSIGGLVPRYPFSLVSTRAREASGAMPADFSSTGASRLGGRW